MASSNQLSEIFPMSGTVCPAFSLILPVYNEEKGLASTLTHLQEILQTSRYEYEVIVVNDGSTDGTEEILHNYTSVKVISHRRNRGYGAALKTGIKQAKYPLIAITDGDGTYPNERIPELVELATEADMVVGARIGLNVRYSRIRKVPKWFLVHFAQWVTRTHIPDLNSGMRVFRKNVVERFLNILPDTFSFTTTITIAMLANDYLVHYQPIDYYHRVGKSKIKPIRDTLRFVQLILRLGVYFAPLRIFLPLASLFFGGFLISLFQDVFIRQDLTESTLILFVAAIQIGLFALLADMIDKRISKL